MTTETDVVVAIKRDIGDALGVMVSVERVIATGAGEVNVELDADTTRTIPTLRGVSLAPGDLALVQRLGREMVALGAVARAGDPEGGGVAPHEHEGGYPDTTRIGAGASAGGEDGLAIGADAVSRGVANTLVGAHTSSAQAHVANTVVGKGAEAGSSGVVAIGAEALAQALRSIAVGEHAQATGERGVALGWNAHAAHVRAVAIGPDAQTEGDDTVKVVGRHFLLEPHGDVANDTRTYYRLRGSGGIWADLSLADNYRPYVAGVQLSPHARTGHAHAAGLGTLSAAGNYGLVGCDVHLESGVLYDVMVIATMEAWGEWGGAGWGPQVIYQDQQYVTESRHLVYEAGVNGTKTVLVRFQKWGGGTNCHIQQNWVWIGGAISIDQAQIMVIAVPVAH